MLLQHDHRFWDIENMIIINNHIPIAPHTLLFHMGLAYCQKLLRWSAWEAFVEGKLWEAYIACGAHPCML
jgi:hypothetical protein